MKMRQNSNSLNLSRIIFTRWNDVWAGKYEANISRLRYGECKAKCTEWLWHHDIWLKIITYLWQNASDDKIRTQRWN